MQISFARRPQTATLTNPGGRRLIRFPLRLGSAPTATRTATGRDDRAERAIAAAAALAYPAKAIGIAKEIRDNPEGVFDPDKVDRAHVKELLVGVGRYLDDASGAPGPEDTHRAAAGSIGASPELVTVATRVIGNDAAKAESAIYWITQSGGEAWLATAGRAAARLNNPRVPSRMDTLEKLREELENARTRLDNAEATGKYNQDAVADLGASTTDLRQHITDLVERVGRLEAAKARTRASATKKPVK